MKIIQAMKEIKEQQQAIAELIKKVKDNAAQMDFETPRYGGSLDGQKATVREWIQSVHDRLERISNLRMSIQRTNLATMVAIKIGDKEITKSISEWIHRRRELAELEKTAWAALTDKNLKDGFLPATSTDAERKAAKVVLFFEPAERDRMVEMFRTEPGRIDSTMEVINAITDLEPANQATSM